MDFILKLQQLIQNRMKTRLVIYQLKDSSEDYSLVLNYIKTFPKWAKPMNRCFLVKSKKRTSEIRDELKRVIHNGGKVMVLDITDSAWATSGVNMTVTSWIKENL